MTPLEGALEQREGFKMFNKMLKQRDTFKISLGKIKICLCLIKYNRLIYCSFLFPKIKNVYSVIVKILCHA